MPTRRPRPGWDPALTDSLVLAGWVVAAEALLLAIEEPATLGDVGAALTVGVGGTLLVGLLVGGVAALARSPWARAAVVAGVPYALVSWKLLAVDTDLVHNVKVLALFAVGTAALFAVAAWIARRLAVRPTVALGCLVVADLVATRVLARGWATRGGNLVRFLASPETAAVGALGAALFLGGVLVLRRRAAAQWALLPAVVLVTALLTERPSGAGAGEGGAAHPDVFVLSFDALRWDVFHERCERGEGPLGQLCRQGVRYQHVFSDGIATYPILAANTRGGAPPGDCAATVPGRLRAAGYHTAMYLARRGERIPGAGCYDRYWSGSGTDLLGAFTVPAVAMRLLRRSDPADGLRHKFLRAGQVASRLAADLEGARAPVFAYLHLLELHAPYVPDRRRADTAYLAEITAFMRDCYVRACRGPAAEGLVARARAGYLESMEDVDAAVATLMAEVARRGRPWIVVVTADHGELLGEHGGFAHSGGFVPELVVVPWLVVDSRRPHAAGRQVCGLRLSSEATADLVGQALHSAGDPPLRPAVERLAVHGPPLGRAEVDAAASVIRYELAEGMAAHRGTWRNVHEADRGEVPWQPGPCEAEPAP